ncbi:MAG: hypothetical protein ETSY1_31045 [Candidatus Entotheonella factor]|uniref:Uncharacterized protein n=1 Tax=Entotheonella factor TaxID=1429438 RepID=W4LBI2_ENTF1|nr:MAG: hypothetical protein ETSY1_31045 [Candidatus Entotheonella factor]
MIFLPILESYLPRSESKQEKIIGSGNRIRTILASILSEFMPQNPSILSASDDNGVYWVYAKATMSIGFGLVHMQTMITCCPSYEAVLAYSSKTHSLP